MFHLIPFAIPALIFVNFWTVLRFWQDKQRALAGERRIPEADFTWVGPYRRIARSTARPAVVSTRDKEEPFSTQLFVIATIQIGLIFGLVIYQLA